MQELTTKNLIIIVIGISVLCEIIRLRLSTLYDDTFQFMIAVFMISYYFIFLALLLGKQIEPLIKLRKTLLGLLVLSILTFMFCSFVIANNNFAHIFDRYLNYTFASGYLALSCTILSVLLESYLKKITDEEIVEDEDTDDKKNFYIP